METPNKIYVHEISAEELTENLPYHVCYLRKDALLGWAKEQKKFWEQSADDALDPWHYFYLGRIDFAQALIDKLNSI